MNHSIVEFKHSLNQNFFKANSFLRENWFKILLVIVAAIIITKKDLNFQFALNDKTEANKQSFEGILDAVVQPAALITGNRGTPEPDLGKITMGETISSSTTEETKVSKAGKETPKKADIKKQESKNLNDNKAQSYSNLGFVLNPSFAKRHNVDQAIVAEKKQILDNYINRYAQVAVHEMKTHGIPASITLAQALLESNAGHSRLAKDANNHFGIKCFSKSCQQNHCRNYTDDTHKDFFRIYKNVWESYRAHSLFLKRDRYKHLQKLKTTDYKAWAHGLKKAGYATDKKYAEKLIAIIEALNLQKFDKK
jgi:flagellum-specific peptidoglycan hydrolase FlgJ